MDLDGDGNDDIISGSYWPGEIWVFWGEGGTSFKKGETLKDNVGDALHAGPTWRNKNAHEMDSLAAAPCAWDGDNDGDYDMLIGNISGGVIFIPNEGTAKKPAFNRANRKPVEAGGKPLKVSGDAGPCIADWDGDGLADLLVGSGDGSVNVYRNIGKKGEPKFARAVELITPTQNNYQAPSANGKAPEHPGIRTKVCVTDWNRDGRVDLLVGDFWYEAAPELKLTEEQVKRRDDLRQRATELQTKMARVMDDMTRKGQKFDHENMPEEYTKLMTESSKIYQDLAALESRPQNHGSVWLYLREPLKTETK